MRVVRSKDNPIISSKVFETKTSRHSLREKTFAVSLVEVYSNQNVVYFILAQNGIDPASIF